MRTMGGRLLAASLALALMLAGACSGAGAPASPQAATGSPSPAASRGPAEPPSTAAPPTAPTEAASTALERITRTLTVSATGEGTVTPDGTTTHEDGVKVTLRASWSDATHEFSWGGDCSGATSPCVLTMDAAKSVTATFAALPAGRCAQPSDADCIRAVYRGAPGDYAQVVDIPADALLEPDANGRYRVARGQQLTVVTAAPLPAGWTRFHLERSPLEFGTPSPVSASQLIAPVGTTYTFTPAADEAASTLITFDLTAARPFVRPRPDGKPELGDVIVTTVFQVETDIFSYDSFDTTGAASAAGSYAFLMPDGTSMSAVTTYEQLRTGSTVMRVNVDDAHGASWASFYNAVEVGDIVEWREADDCWARYRATSASSGGSSTRDIGVEWETYAATGCSGAVSATGAITMQWAPPPFTTAGLAAPVRHGPYLLRPAGWAGALEPSVTVPPEVPGESSTLATDPRLRISGEIAVVRGHPWWREPALPEGWTLHSAAMNFEGIDGYRAIYTDARGGLGAEVWVTRLRRLPADVWVVHAWGGPYESGTIDGHPALIQDSGPANAASVHVFDEASGIEYIVVGVSPRATLAVVTAAVRSLYAQASE